MQNELISWTKLLTSCGIKTVSSVKKIGEIPLADTRLEYYLLAHDEAATPIAIHVVSTKRVLSASEFKAIMRGSRRPVSSSVIISYGDESNLNITVVNSSGDTTFQCVDILDEKSEIIADMQKAANKKTANDKVDVIYKALDFEALSNSFFNAAKECKEQFEHDIHHSMGKIKDLNFDQDVSHYAIILMSRMIFLHFLEQKKLLNYNINYVRNKIVGDEEQEINPIKNLWTEFLLPIFDAINNPKAKRSNPLIKKDDFPYLNGGLFAPYAKIENRPEFAKCKLKDDTIRDFYQNCLYKYRITSKENETGSQGILDAELLELFLKNS